MSGISDVTVQHDAKVNLLSAIRAALDGEKVDTVFGFRWPLVENDWFAVTETESDIDPATIGARRSVDENITLWVSVGSWQMVIDGNGHAAEVAASERAFALLAKVQRHIRLDDITLGGVVLWCMPGSSSSAGATTEDESGYGRITEISASFVCRHKIR